MKLSNNSFSTHSLSINGDEIRNTARVLGISSTTVIEEFKKDHYEQGLESVLHLSEIEAGNDSCKNEPPPDQLTPSKDNAST